MARSKNIENMSFAELAAMQARIERAKTEKQSSERAALKEKLADMAKKAGFDLRELFDGRKGKGTVAVKYRDGTGNTWTGRGRMPRWMTAANEGREGEERGFLDCVDEGEGSGVTPAPIEPASAGPLLQPGRALPARFSPTSGRLSHSRK